jgi:hypothetical protein
MQLNKLQVLLPETEGKQAFSTYYLVTLHIYYTVRFNSLDFRSE